MLCYKFLKIHQNNNNYFDPSIDVTYIIHLENNGRYSNIIKQLQIFQPTSKTYILINKGFKKCNKPGINITHQDLVDCYKVILRHANFNNFGNILILEDDFIFSKDILDINICNDINNYINFRENDKFLYFLGCIPSLTLPTFDNHNKVLVSLGTHATIYSKGFVKYHKLFLNKVDDWDNYSGNFEKIMYYKPLCYQLFPDTENSRNWTNNLSTFVIKKILKNRNLDRKVEPGYSLFYEESKKNLVILIILIIIISIFIIYLIYRKYN